MVMAWSMYMAEAMAWSMNMAMVWSMYMAEDKALSMAMIRSIHTDLAASNFDKHGIFLNSFHF